MCKRLCWKLGIRAGRAQPRSASPPARRPGPRPVRICRLTELLARRLGGGCVGKIAEPALQPPAAAPAVGGGGVPAMQTKAKGSDIQPCSAVQGLASRRPPPLLPARTHRQCSCVSWPQIADRRRCKSESCCRCWAGSSLWKDPSRTSSGTSMKRAGGASTRSRVTSTTLLAMAWLVGRVWEGLSTVGPGGACRGAAQSPRSCSKSGGTKVRVSKCVGSRPLATPASGARASAPQAAAGWANGAMCILLCGVS